MRRPMLAALSAILVLALAGPATADHGGIHPTLRTEQSFFHCVGDTKVQNVSFYQGQVPSWNTTPPAGSVQAGHGCGYYEPLITNALPVPFDAVWQGTFTGNLRDLTIELHRLLPAQGATVPNRLTVAVLIDGEERLNNNNVTVTPVPSSNNASQSARITLTGLGYETEDADGTQQRTIRIQVGSWNETQSAWVFDSTEVPAGITFNPATPTGTILTAA